MKLWADPHHWLQESIDADYLYTCRNFGNLMILETQEDKAILPRSKHLKSVRGSKWKPIKVAVNPYFVSIKLKE
jgi:hypothetical protein